MLKKLLERISIPTPKHLKSESRKRVLMRRYLAAVLCGCMVAPTIGSIAMATEEQPAKDPTGLCEHHTVHDANCGYVEAVEGAECQHTHDENCGYVEAKDEVPCYCPWDEAAGMVVHAEGCGYQAPVEGQPCNHVHDADCGYAEAVEGQPCGYVCEICSGEEIGSEPTPLSDAVDAQPDALADNADDTTANPQENPEPNPLQVPELTQLPKEQTCTIIVPERELIVGQSYTLAQLVDGVTAKIEDSSAKTDEVTSDAPEGADEPTKDAPAERSELAVGIQKITQTVGEETQTFDPIAEDFSLAVVADAAYTITYFAYNAADEAKTVLGTKDVSIIVTAVVGNVMVGSQGYDTLTEAIADVASGEVADSTIKVNQDLSENVIISNDMTIDLNGHTLNSGEVGKNVVTILGGTVTIQNGVITGGDRGDRTNQDGKGVLTNNADVTLKNCEIKNNNGYGKKGTTPGYQGNQGGYGGGVYAYGGTLTLEKCTISENKSASKGGGIYAENCAVTVKSTKLQDNTSGSGAPSGGGIMISNGSLKINDSIISGNIASNGNGNAIALTGSVEVEITGTELSSNASGSVIYANYGTGTVNIALDNVDVVNKGDAYTHYAIYSNLTGTFTAKNCTFCDSNGGIQLKSATQQTYENCKFLNNDTTSSSAQAPVWVSAGDASFSNCTFTGNKGFNAGAIYNTSTGTVTIDGCLLNQNSATNSTGAGAIYTSKGTMAVTKTVIKENTTSGGSSSGPAGGVSVNGSGAVFNMASGALYNNKSEKTTAHDVYINSSAKVNILAGKDMKDDNVDFSNYSWSDLSNNVVNDALTDVTRKWSTNWVATPAPEYAASIGETKYKTLDDAYEAARKQSRQTGENVTIEVAEGYIPLGSYWGVSQKTSEGKYYPSVTLHLNNTNIYGINDIKNSFSIAENCTLTLSGTGTLNKNIYMMGGTLNLDGNVVLSGGTLQWGKTAIYDNKNVNTKVNINGNVDSVQIGLYAGACTIGENAHIRKMEAWMTSTSSGTPLETTFTMNGKMEELILRQATAKSTATLNGSIDSLNLTYGTEIYSTPTVPKITAGEKFSVKKLLSVYPALNSVDNAESYDKTTGRNISDGLVSLKALQDPAQKVDDLILIYGGGAGLPENATWTTGYGVTHTDKKDYKFLTTVTKDENNNIVLRKTAVGNGNYVFIGGSGASDNNDGITLNTPVKTFAKALEILKANLEANKAVNEGVPKIHVLGTVSVTGDETWDPITASVKSADGAEAPFDETVTLESFPTFNGELVNVPSSASLTLENITIDGKGISRTTPLVENRGTLNINSGTKLTGGVNSVIYNPNNGSGIDGGAVYNSGKLNMTGGEISGNSARTGGGVFNKGTFNLSGDGKISDNTGYDLKRFQYSMGGSQKMNSAPAGGGVFLSGTNGIMNMSGGIISGNTSCVGGGISLGNETNAYVSYGGAKLNMTGGVIDGNTAVTEGGGIFIQEMCEATITGGEIRYNHSNGSVSVATGYSFLYGGGGIYVNGGTGMTNKDGVLKLANVAITQNTSDSRGGGIAGCPSANVEVMMGDSSVLGNNKVKDKLYDAYINRTRIVGPVGTTHSGGTKFYLSKYMKGGALYKWHYYEDDTPVLYQDISDITYKFDAVDKTKKREAGFYSAAAILIEGQTETSIDKNAKNCAVKIYGNHSVMGGGGIGTNGLLEIGKVPASDDFFDVTVTKKWLNTDGTEMTHDEMLKLKEQIESITVRLERRVVKPENGVEDNWELVDSRLITADETGFWATERPFKNLLKQLDGQLLEYRIVEEASLTGAWSEVSGGKIRIVTPPIRENAPNFEVEVLSPIDPNTFIVTYPLKWTPSLESQTESVTITLEDTKNNRRWTWTGKLDPETKRLTGLTLSSESTSEIKVPEVRLTNKDSYTGITFVGLDRNGRYAFEAIYMDKDGKVLEAPSKFGMVEFDPEKPDVKVEPEGTSNLLNLTPTLDLIVKDSTLIETNLRRLAKSISVTLTDTKNNEHWTWTGEFTQPPIKLSLDPEKSTLGAPRIIVQDNGEQADGDRIGITFEDLYKNGEYSIEVKYEAQNESGVDIGTIASAPTWSYKMATEGTGNDVAPPLLVNKLNEPELTLVKEIVGDLGDKEFSFTITFTHGTNTIDGGLQSIKGSGFRSITIPDGVRAGDRFTITETEGNWNTKGTIKNLKTTEFGNLVAEGTLCYGENTVTFTNTERGLLEIPVEKTIKFTGDKPATIPDFHFTLEPNTDTSGSGQHYSNVTLADDLTIEGKTFKAGTKIQDVNNGVIPIEIKGNNFKYSETNKAFKPFEGRFPSLRFGAKGTYKFTVKETVDSPDKNWTYDSTEWIVTVNVTPDEKGKLNAAITNIVDAGNSKQTVQKDKPVPFTNTYEAGSLSISKKVEGNTGDKTKGWSFEVALSAPEGITLADSYTYTVGNSEKTLTLIEGKVTITLKHGEIAKITGLPVGTTYTVIEAEANKDGYTTTVSGNGKLVPEEGKVGYTGTIEATSQISSKPTKPTESGTSTDPAVPETLEDSTDITAPESSDATTDPAIPVASTELHQAAYVAFVNTRNETPPDPTTGSLTIHKTVTGVSTEEPFTFILKLAPPAGGNLDGMKFSDNSMVTANGAIANEYVVTLKYNAAIGGYESLVVSGLPQGTQYNVTETETNGYTVSLRNQDGTPVLDTLGNPVTMAEGTITESNLAAYAGFNNAKVNTQPGSLTISKTVSGNRSSTQRDFTFTVILRDANKNLLTDPYDYTGSTILEGATPPSWLH